MIRTTIHLTINYGMVMLLPIAGDAAAAPGLRELEAVDGNVIGPEDGAPAGAGEDRQAVVGCPNGLVGARSTAASEVKIFVVGSIPYDKGITGGKKGISRANS